MAKKREYYSMENLLKVHADYNLLIGMNNNGKSYQVKLFCLTQAFENHKFVYLRRYKEDIKQYAVESYFGDMPVSKITNGQYDSVTAFQGYIYFSLEVEGKMKRGPRIGRYCALSEYQRYKSTTFVGYDNIIYEEFITDDIYLSEEPLKLQRFVTIVARDRKVRVWMVGNTMSRVVPYFGEWNLKGSLTQKKGTIEIYHESYEGIPIDIAVEMCGVIDSGSKMFFGNAAKQIVSGEWSVKEYPRLPFPYKEYSVAYEMQVQYQMFAFNIRLMVKDDTALGFVSPAKVKKKKGRIITDVFSDNALISPALDPRFKGERILQKLYRQNKFCYTDNLTGSDFNQLLAQFHFI